MLEVFKWLVFGGVLLVLLPYAFIAAWGLVVGLWRQLPGRTQPEPPEAPPS